MNELFNYEYYRATGTEYRFYKYIKLYRNPALRYLYFLRKEQIPNCSFSKKIYNFQRKRLQIKYGLDINCMQMGGELSLAILIIYQLTQRLFWGKI